MMRGRRKCGDRKWGRRKWWNDKEEAEIRRKLWNEEGMRRRRKWDVRVENVEEEELMKWGREEKRGGAFQAMVVGVVGFVLRTVNCPKFTTKLSLDSVGSGNRLFSSSSSSRFSFSFLLPASPSTHFSTPPLPHSSPSFYSSPFLGSS